MKTVIAYPLRNEVISEANRREHWARKYQRVKAHRFTAKTFSKIAFQKADWHWDGETNLAISMTRVIKKRGKLMDDDNLTSSLKATRDGISDALDTADNNPHIKWVCYQRRGDLSVVKSYVDVVITEERDGEE